MSTILVAKPSELLIKGVTQRINIRLEDEDRNPVDATSLKLTVFNSSDDIIFTDDIDLGYGIEDDAPTLPTALVHGTTGIYYFPFGDTTVDDSNTTDTVGEYLFHWQAVGTAGTEEISNVVVVKVVSVRTMRWLPRLRLIIDKAAKDVDDNPDDPCFVGYTDAMLAQFLEDGLHWTNAMQPYPTWASIDLFPEIHSRILIDGAVCAALTSQELFAVDTDVGFSDQGNAWNIDHQPKLSAILNATWTRFAATVPAMKRQYVNSGSIHVNISPNFRLQSILNSAPPGSFLAGYFFNG